VLREIASDDPVLGVLHREAFLTVPARCPSCGSALTASELSMQIPNGVTGEPMSEAAPFGRMVIGLDAPHPPAYPHPIDASLFERLREVLGVTYRHVGRLLYFHQVNLKMVPCDLRASGNCELMSL
jgi:hypothetical protein